MARRAGAASSTVRLGLRCPQLTPGEPSGTPVWTMLQVALDDDQRIDEGSDGTPIWINRFMQVVGRHQEERRAAQEERAREQTLIAELATMGRQMMECSIAKGKGKGRGPRGLSLLVATPLLPLLASPALPPGR